MNARRLTILAVRTAVFVVLALVVAVVNGWSAFAVAAVALTSTALAIQLAGLVWTRRTHRRTAEAKQ